MADTTHDDMSVELTDYQQSIKRIFQLIRELDGGEEVFQSILATEKQRGEVVARLKMVEYFDQCPANDLMDWKGLFADTRKLLEAELAALDGVLGEQ